VRKSFSAFGTSSGKYLSAVACGHSFSEAVFHLSLTLLGLVCSFHIRPSFPIIVKLLFCRFARYFCFCWQGTDAASNQAALETVLYNAVTVMITVQV
jgi:hypothetical protein